MSAGKRIFAVVIIILSIVGIVLCVGGIIGTWIVEDRLTRVTVNLLSSAEEMLQTVGNGLDRVEHRPAGCTRWDRGHRASCEGPERQS